MSPDLASNARSKVEIALTEAKAKFTRYEIDLKNKPDWYAPKVNPVGEVRDYKIYKFDSCKLF